VIASEVYSGFLSGIILEIKLLYKKEWKAKLLLCNTVRNFAI